MADKKAAFFKSYRALLSVEVIGIVVLAALIGALAGPFGTFSAMGFGLRLIYWALVSTMSVLLGYVAFALARGIGCKPGTSRHNAVGSVFMAVLITMAVRVLDQLVYPHILIPPPFLFLFFNILLIAMAVGVVRRMISPTEDEDIAARPQAPVPDAVTAEAVRPRLARRLPEGIDGAILHLSVSDHHVDIHTETGTASVRMRLADAIEAMDGVPGMRVHRSHWVAREAIDGVVRENGRLFLSLRTGARVPVSRGARPVLEEMGLV
ncbi:MAG: LytTR family transcriptional regulator [Rhodobacteraceae bacterium]|nr:LytTR family transcriptional regulator [Paracoccaceae bacterium]